MAISEKIKDLDELCTLAEDLRSQGKKIVLCHGVYDLLHIGHIKHLEEARTHGDVLVVTITPDHLVDKGPHRPAFTGQLRLEALAALSCVDYVALNQWPTAVELIKRLKPDLYVKGGVRQSGPRDHTHAIVDEEEAIESIGGSLLLTGKDLFSSSTLINRHTSILSPEAQEFLGTFRSTYSELEILDYLNSIKDLRILLIGESIIDEYNFCRAMNKANKDPILATKHLYTEKYAGGILSIANHLAGFCGNISALTFLGDHNSQEEFVRSKISSKVDLNHVTKPDSPTIVKRRFLEEYMSVKLFEIDEINDDPLMGADEDKFCDTISDLLPKFDIVIICDYGHGLMTDKSISLVCDKAKFLAVNTQTNSMNHGFNFVSKYPNADFAVIDEPEARLEMRSRKTDITKLAPLLADKMACNNFMITRGSNGTLCYSPDVGLLNTPVFSSRLVDRMGAGDACLALTAPCALLGAPLEALGFIGNVAGAAACSIMGNREPINPISILRHITSLMK